MFFGEVPTLEAVGALLAHGLSVGTRTLKKGCVLTAEDVVALAAEGHQRVVVARLDPGDVAEDEAARRAAVAIAGPGLQPTSAFAGRVNLIAQKAGLVRVDEARIDALNRIDEALALATVRALGKVRAGQIAATLKIIPFAVREQTLAAWDATAGRGGPPLSLEPFSPWDVGLLQTRLPGVKDAVLASTAAVTRERLELLGSRLMAGALCAHRVEDVARELDKLKANGARLILMVGASATLDRRDVLPAALTHLGGEVLHLGMPVDPGDLLMLGRLGSVPVLGLPDCARSPKFSGFDMVLRRVLAGVPVDGADIAGMGVGGLLQDIASRPAPRMAPVRVEAEHVVEVGFQVRTDGADP